MELLSILKEAATKIGSKSLVDELNRLETRFGVGRIVGGTLGLLWHKRVCMRCGHIWWFEVELDAYDDYHD